jgi:hypothetical protein
MSAGSLPRLQVFCTAKTTIYWRLEKPVFPVIEFNKAAFKHGVTETDIRYAMWHPLHEQLLEAYINKWLIVGYDTAGNLIEVVYNSIDKDTVNVFHAMPCRKQFASQISL